MAVWVSNEGTSFCWWPIFAKDGDLPLVDSWFVPGYSSVTLAASVHGCDTRLARLSPDRCGGY